MAICFGTLIFACTVFGLVFFLHRNREQIRNILRRSTCPNDGGNQCPMLNSGNEKAVQSGKPYHMTMGLKRLDAYNWLTVEPEYLREHAIRKELLDNSLPCVLQCLPGTELACEETLRLVASFLTSRYPDMFFFDQNQSLIHNKATGESFPLLGGSGNSNPLEIAARLAMEDFNILMKDPSDEQYHLMASATLFPVGWKLQERIGGSMAALHNPVPNWQQKLGCPIDRYFDRLSPTSTMERRNTFIQIGTTLFQTTPPPSTPTPTSNHIPPSNITLRLERQTFRRLPQSKAILFTVHTYMNPITTLIDTELREFVEQMKGWPVETARYKGRDYWGPAVERYARERLGEGGKV